MSPEPTSSQKITAITTATFRMVLIFGSIGTYILMSQRMRPINTSVRIISPIDTSSLGSRNAQEADRSND